MHGCHWDCEASFYFYSSTYPLLDRTFWELDRAGAQRNNESVSHRPHRGSWRFGGNMCMQQSANTQLQLKHTPWRRNKHGAYIPAMPYSWTSNISISKLYSSSWKPDVRRLKLRHNLLLQAQATSSDFRAYPAIQQSIYDPPHGTNEQSHRPWLHACKETAEITIRFQTNCVVD